MQCRPALFFPLLAALLLSLWCTDRADAIPAFSRLHKTECTTCHTIYPELNEYGEAFLKNSFVYMGKGLLPQVAIRESGVTVRRI